MLTEYREHATREVIPGLILRAVHGRIAHTEEKGDWLAALVEAFSSGKSSRAACLSLFFRAQSG
jgi:hypothetical protein